MAESKKREHKNLYAVIMAGGKGTRFWPLSRETFPKQFLKIVGERTLIQETIHRLYGEVKPSNTLIVTTKGQSDIVRWQLMEILEDVKCVIEPEGRNTAAAIALAAYKLHKKNPRASMLVLPSDHYISDVEAFRESVRLAAEVAEKGSIATFGIKPSRPETGYGYIKAGKKLRGGVYAVEKFVEKPAAKTAKSFVKEGSYYWNSGMFLFKTSVIIDEFKRYMPEVHEAFVKIRPKLNTSREDDALAEIYGSLPNVSIDYGVMEKSGKVAMVAASFPWSDIGSWSALDEVLDRDASGNVSLGNVVGLDCEDSIFFEGGTRLIAALGLKDMVVVDTADATLIAPKDDVQKVKDLVGRLKEEGKEEYLTPRVEERPWGYFSVLEKGPNHQIKHIYLKPRARLSLQYHNHRSEHWIVVAGTAKVQRGEEVFFVHKNESTFIPATMQHRLENPGLIPLRIIEIQSGEYLGEDDIIRSEDLYGRKTG
ncbi:MAG: mannose-1-phosphate guanylyltransferase/mannose-6-phosphate isomerase [Nitrospirota bacterium]|jgi:mannose-1-phosphate guanylyltransferase/mannose-6-phosphate isomerase